MNFVVVSIVMLALCCGVHGTEYTREDVINQLAEGIMQEIARRENVELNFEDLESHSVKRSYNSIIASNVDNYDLQMRARTSDGFPVSCRATVSYEEDTGRMNINGYSIQDQKRSGYFSRRSEKTPCSDQEAKAAVEEAMKAINEGVDDQNSMLGMDSMLDMPELEQSHFEFVKKISCFKANTDDGEEFTVKLTAKQNGVNETCDIVLVKHSDENFDVTQNQCQGSN